MTARRGSTSFPPALPLNGIVRPQKIPVDGEAAVGVERPVDPGEKLMQDDVVAFFAYDRWANTKVCDACRKLTAEQYAAEPVPGWSSVRSTVNHIALATVVNLRSLAGGPNDPFPTEADLATVDDAARLLERAYRRVEELRPL